MEFFYDQKDLLGKDLYMLERWSSAEGVASYFEDYEYITNFTSYRNGKNIGKFYLYHMKKLKYIETNSLLKGNFLIKNVFRK